MSRKGIIHETIKTWIPPIIFILVPLGLEMSPLGGTWTASAAIWSVAFILTLVYWWHSIRSRKLHWPIGCLAVVLIIGGMSIAVRVSALDNPVSPTIPKWKYELHQKTDRTLIVEFMSLDVELPEYTAIVSLSAPYRDMIRYTCISGDPFTKHLLATITKREQRYSDAYIGRFVSPPLSERLHLCLEFQGDAPIKVTQVALTE